MPTAFSAKQPNKWGVSLFIPTALIANFHAHLDKKGVAADRFQEYRKWLHFFLDFCDKYQKDGDNAILFLFRYALKKRFRTNTRCTTGKEVIVYTHCVPVMTVKDAKSPLDF